MEIEPYNLQDQPVPELKYAIGGQDFGTGPGNAACNKGLVGREMVIPVEVAELRAPRPGFLQTRVLNLLNKTLNEVRSFYPTITFKGDCVLLGSQGIASLGSIALFGHGVMAGEVNQVTYGAWGVIGFATTAVTTFGIRCIMISKKYSRV